MSAYGRNPMLGQFVSFPYWVSCVFQASSSEDAYVHGSHGLLGSLAA